MAAKYILSLDQGTTGSRAIVFDKNSREVGSGYVELTQHYPKPGWVEQDANEIWETVLGAVEIALERSKVESHDLAAIGITNQRETTILWDRVTGEPLHNAIVWQCRRTADICDKLRQEGWEEKIMAKTGLVLDAYFSATKIKWILDRVEGLREKAKKGEVLFGNVDAWLLWKLSGGVIHLTDYSNASRTMIFDIKELEWDGELLELFDIPRSILPQVRPSSEVYGSTVPHGSLSGGIPIAGVAGDQQASLFGQACYRPGMAKCTYGTGSFILMNLGTKPTFSKGGLLTTLAWGLDGRVDYALEGGNFIAGAAVQWLRDELKIIEKTSDTETLALSVSDTGGVYLVPAFVGLGAPYWDMYARGTLVGLTRGTKREHLARATLEAIAYQVVDVLKVMEAEAGLELRGLRVDGGAATNNFLMQFQGDILAADVLRPKITETTALGAAFLAGLGVGYWESTDQIAQMWELDRRFSPSMDTAKRDGLYRGWKRAVDRSLKCVEE